VVISFDPMHQIHNNENGYLWQRKGKDGTKQDKANSGRTRLTILGGVDLVSHQIVPLITESNCDIYLMEVYLEEVKKAYPDAETIVLFLDNARYQRNYQVQEKAKQLGIELKYLPPYTPNLALVERIWKFFKKKVIKNSYYHSFQEFWNAVCSFFEKWDKWLPELESLLSLKFEIIS